MEPSGHGGYGWTDRNAAIKDIHKSRIENTSNLNCSILMNTIEVEIEQGGGWDSGGASVDEINTPGDFGCNKFEKYDVET